MDSAGLRWYRTGTVDITQGSTNVTGVGTNWQTAGIQPGDVFMVGNSVLYEIADIGDNTNIILQSAFQGATGTAQNYSILRNFAGTMQAQIAAQVAELVNKYESYIDTELKQIVGPAGPTSFPYRGSWATGRQYNALDVVEYNNALYMAVAGHTSTTDNAPGAANTEWMSLSVSLSGTVLTAFANGASVNPNGANGISIVGKNADNDVTLSAASDAIRLQQTSGGTTTTLLQLPGTLSADVTALTGRVTDVKNNKVTAEDTGWTQFTPNEAIKAKSNHLCYYRRKNGFVTVSMVINTSEAFANGMDKVIAFTLPEGFRPSISQINGAIVIQDGTAAIGHMQIMGASGYVYVNIWGSVPANKYWVTSVTYPV